MTGTAKRLSSCAALALIFASSSVYAGTHPAIVPAILQVSAWGQTASPNSSANRRKEEDLLRKARQAMSQGNFQLAESYIGQAEALNVDHQQNALFKAFVDTPEKVRRELERTRQEGLVTPRRTIPRLIRTLRHSRSDEQSDVPQDPFTTRDGEQLPGELTGQTPKAMAQDYLEKGRLALEQRQLTTAVKWYQKSLELNVNYEPGEYSPAQLREGLRLASVDVEFLTTRRLPQPLTTPNQFASESNRKPSPSNDLPSTARDPNPLFLGPRGRANTLQFSPSSQQLEPPPSFVTPSRGPTVAATEMMTGDQSLLRAARLALAAGDLGRANAMLDREKKQPEDYSLHDDSPEKIQQLLRRAKQLTAGPESGTDQRTYTRDHARFLMDQSEGMMRYGDYEVARRLARQAQSLRAEFGQFERTPDDLLREIISKQSGPSAGPRRLSNDVTSSKFSANPSSLFHPPPAAPSQNYDEASATMRALIADARQALAQGDIPRAESLVQQAKVLNIPDHVFVDGDPRPWMLDLEIDNAKRRQSQAVQQAGGAGAISLQSTDASTSRYGVQRSVYHPETDLTRNVQAGTSKPAGNGQGETPSINRTVQAGAENSQSSSTLAQGSGSVSSQRSPALEYVQKGENALTQGNVYSAREFFRKAWKDEGSLDPVIRERLQDHLQMLNAPMVPQQVPQADESSSLEEVSTEQAVLFRQLVTEVAQQRRQAEKLSQTDPRGALKELNAIRERVARSELTSTARKQLLTRVDISINQLKKLIADNLSQIELNERNRDVKEHVERDRLLREEIQNKLAGIVEKFNQLTDEQRYAEAEVLVRQARQLDPENPVTENLVWKGKLIRQLRREMDVREKSEDGFVTTMGNVHKSKIPYDDEDPLQFPDRPTWERLRERRDGYLTDSQTHLTEKELEIQRQLKEPVEVRFENRPLVEVMDTLANMTGVNMYLDPQGLSAEGITSDSPVTINLNQAVSLNSALALILHPLRLSFVIQNEVLKITSEQTRDSAVYTRVYNVADLVIPIPNFIPNYNNMGLGGALANAHRVGYGAAGRGGGTFDMPMSILAGNGGTGDSVGSASTLAQLSSAGLLGSQGSRNQVPVHGPGGVGGGPQPDFDSLIELITTTIAPTSWDEVGGPGSIAEFDGNLSLVISQTQEVHRQIADLLEQLRRLQDLQVTIEVRFITLTDDFFERMGVDFNFDIDDNVTTEDATIDTDSGPSITIGWDPTGAPTADLDLKYSQKLFGGAIPAFGGFDAGTAANFGFAILSDIEAFFVIQAVQGDNRANILQAPKVTLFNGQQAFVSDTAQKPFVTSVIPVVGDFAAAQQPVIVVLNEGTSLSVQAVVSPDRRFVRLTLVPFFSKIGEVDEFTFTGRTSTNTGTIDVDPTSGASVQNTAETVTEGTTVQLPTFAFTTVTTTVSVPDGGTVLLGGIKRLKEGRTEKGIPMLSKLPYLNRLFNNVAIGREAQSMMLMVTPRIIIQEEEEEDILGSTSGP